MLVTHEVGHCLGFMHNMSASAVGRFAALSVVPEIRRPPRSWTMRASTSWPAGRHGAGRADDASPFRRLRLLRCQMALYAGLRRASPEVYKITHRGGSPRPPPIPCSATASSRAPCSIPARGRDLDDAVKASSTASATCALHPRQSERLGEGRGPRLLPDRHLQGHRQPVYRYIGHVFANVGGIYLNEKHVGDPVDAYKSVPKAPARRRAVPARPAGRPGLDDEWTTGPDAQHSVHGFPQGLHADRFAIIRAVVMSAVVETRAVSPTILPSRLA